MNAEPVYEFQREAISTAFQCPVRETYGMAEIVAAAGECGNGRLHQWPEAGIIETGADVGGGLSEFICTGLMNADMPLIRYRVGDSGKLSINKCVCGRTLPVIEGIAGRTDDVLFAKDGRQIGRMDPVFKGGMPIKEAQVVQESLSRITVNYVPADDFRNEVLTELTTRIRDGLGTWMSNLKEWDRFREHRGENSERSFVKSNQKMTGVVELKNTYEEQ